VFRTRLSAARRFSQPLSGFSRPKLHGLISCRNRSWDPPSERSPSENRAPLSRPHAPLKLSTRLPSRAALALSRDVSPTPTPERSSLDPRPAMSSLSANPVRPTSRSLWAQTANPPLSASFTFFEALFLSQVRSLPTRVAPRRRPLLSWVSSPSEFSPTTPRRLHPRKPRGQAHSLEPGG